MATSRCACVLCGEELYARGQSNSHSLPRHIQALIRQAFILEDLARLGNGSGRGSVDHVRMCVDITHACTTMFGDATIS
jgi:hypothetical protein